MNLRIIGDKQIFAIEFAFEVDPDNGLAVTPEEATSWGYFTFWVNGKNLCRYIVPSEVDSEYYPQYYVHWYILPIIDWFTNNWEPLFFEEAPPSIVEKSYARAMFLERSKQYLGLGSEEEHKQWFEWWQRHAFRACRDGGIFPDIFIRGYGDNVEFSWGNAELPGAPHAAYYVTPAGFDIIKREYVCNTVKEFLTESIKILLNHIQSSDIYLGLRQKILSLGQPNKVVLKWLVPAIRAGNISIDEFVALVNKKFPNINDLDMIPAPILMFGTFSPNLCSEDIDAILSNITVGAESELLEQYASTIEHSHEAELAPHNQGYKMAEDVLQKLNIDTDCEYIDLNKILNVFSIDYTEAVFTDTLMRGVAISGQGIAPKIFINSRSTYNNGDAGKLFTLAHEFCHILYDRNFGKEVGIASGPWAPLRVEKRANAFAAMLLMPIKLITRYIGMDWGNFEAVAHMAEKMCVSRIALIEHLYNLGFIDWSTREEFKEKINSSLPCSALN